MPFDTIRVGCAQPDLHERIRVALVNMPLQKQDIEQSYNRRPNLSRRRQDDLYQLLNDIVRSRSQEDERVNLAVFPEVSIPHAWQPQIVAWARKHQIGVVCGLEHRIDNRNVVLNEILTALPYRDKNGHLLCVPIRRLKKVYSPHEAFTLVNTRLSIPENDRSHYPEPRFQLIRWRGITFTVYNCYELADIVDRGLFRGKVDFIVASEANHDINYFSNIVESAARDLHCYVIQVNDATYGDSRIVSPSKTELMNPLRVKGGDSITFLTITLPLGKLREHQRLLHPLQKKYKEYKQTPPGFNHCDADERILLGRRS